jgi:2-succinyl-6-hydroxy-2,4-cyclohexadiene-1-carboxylate synthase
VDTPSYLHYRISGSGDPVIFLHGFMEDTSIWDNIVPEFGDKQCILIDLHGHGGSFFDAEQPPAIALMATQVKALLDHLGISHYQLVGHSLGGYVGLELLRTDPALEHLTLLHSHPWADPETKKRDRDRVIELVKTKAKQFIREAIPNLFAFPQQHPEAVEQYCRIAEKMDPAAIGWSSAAMRDRPDYTDAVKKHPKAVSIIQGQLDPLIPNIKLGAFAGEHGVGFYEIPRCGHMGQEEQPKEVVEILRVILG